MTAVALEALRVVRNVRETADTFTLTLDAGERPGGGFAFAPGQFNMLYALGRGEAPISVSGDPARPGTLVHTIRAVGDVTRALVAARRGDEIGVRGPFGTAWPVAEADVAGRDVVVVAGGLGLAPLRPAILELLRLRPALGRLELVYGARTPADILFRKEVEAWRGRLDVNVHVTVDRAGPDWKGRLGVVTQVLPRLRFAPENALALVCGPELMMRFTARDLLARGVPAGRIVVSVERSMKCGVGLCGHCQLGPRFVCKDGPVFRWDDVVKLVATREL
ncbi:MAG TPA: FAD/NAD(P)-binding protein [Planctomycetota bacterium]|nr:FAD/NAD(P)-binding protein [Planctomycetota bacterium]